MTRKTLIFAAALVATLVSVVVADVYHWRDDLGRDRYSDRPAPGAERLQIDPGVSYRIVRFVYDGDTVTLKSGERVRLLGINTPEVESAKRRGESGGQAARRWLKARIEGAKVRLEPDVTRHDRYGRTLAHLFAEDGTHLNRVLVERGLAVVNIHPPNLKYAARLLAAQRNAERAGRGIWGDPAYRPRPITDLLERRLRGWQRLRGTPQRIKRSRRYLRLVFSDRIDVRIPNANLDLFPEIEALLGRQLEVRGWPSRRKRRYSVLIRHPSALVVIGSAGG